MENNPLVSIIINCYNSEAYLKETIDSVISQEYYNWELIFWDNQSSDNSKSIVFSYNDERIKYFYAPTHTSLGEGRNLALTKVSGDYISFLDADDLLLPQHLSLLLAAFVSKRVGIVYSNCFIYKQSTNSKMLNDNRVRESGNVYSSWLNYYNVLLPSVMFRKKVLIGMDEWFDPRFSMVEEYDFFLRIAYKWDCEYVFSASSLWRKHDQSLSFRKREQWLLEFKMLYAKIYDFNSTKETIQKLKCMEEHIAYLEFIESAENKQIDRSIISSYIPKNRKLLLAYIVSFLGHQMFNVLLNFFRKRVN
ncbi:glycosyltransferase family 2 protein [Shewanella sp. PP-Sp27a-2]